MIAKLFLGLVSLLYLALSIWCTVAPATTSAKVGFERVGGSGRSEFLVIYGGLELAMALLFAAPLVDASFLRFSLWSCLVIHACLVAYRTAGYFVFSDIAPMTHRLAAGEWVILLCAAICFFWSESSDPGTT